MRERRGQAALVPPVGHPRFPFVDSCRALAALSVLLYHVEMTQHGTRHGALAEIALHLSIGVPVFFAISGFVLYRPFVSARLAGARRPALREYARRRILRIIPAYWAALTALAFLAHWHEVFGPDAWRYYGFVQIYDNRTFSGGLSVAWTLCIEVSFYVLLPFYAAALDKITASRRHPARSETAVLLALAGLSLAFRQAAGDAQSFPTQTLAGTWAWFAPGMLLAIWSVRSPRTLARLGEKHATLTWALALGVFLTLSYSNPLGLLRTMPDVLAPVCAFLLLAPALAGHEARRLPHRILGHRMLLWLGLVSYPIYLYHGTLMAWLAGHDVGRLFPVSPWLALAAASIAAAVVAAAASWYCIERPVLQWGKRSVPRPRATSWTASASPNSSPLESESVVV